jgi:hypothetical protein
VHEKNPAPLNQSGIYADCASRKRTNGEPRRVKINQLETITDDVVEAAASIQVIGN